MTSTPSAHAAMVLVPGGSFRMGSSDFYVDERPVHERAVAAFEIDRHPVTNLQFAGFVHATGYVTVAERRLDPADFPGASPADLQPGGLVFTPTRVRSTSATGASGGAGRSAPGGGSRTARGRASTADLTIPSCRSATKTLAPTRNGRAGGRLPTEAEWEYAAGGSTTPGTYAWGEEPRPDRALMANTWQGAFPYRNTGAAGWVGTSPVGTFAPNVFGLVDMIGNVWEWTSDYYTSSHARTVASASDAPAPMTVDPPQGGVAQCGCGPTDGRGPTMNSQAEAEHAARESAEPGSGIPRRVLKGGSHLCAPEYCLRYRPAARSPQAQDTATRHIGFRLARSR